ncbi:putative isopenicillin N synthase [Helianthus anomalus]
MDTKCTIPIINFLDLPNQMSNLIKASEEWGCFRLINCHNLLPVSLISDMKVVVRSLLDLPAEVKRRNLGVIVDSGYMAPSPKNPLYESLGLYNTVCYADIDKFCSQLDASPHQRHVCFTGFS